MILEIIFVSVVSGIIFAYMMHAQKKKEEAAQRQFDLTMEILKVRGAKAARKHMEKK